MGNSQLPRPRIGLKRTSAASVRGWPGQPSGASRGPPLWLSVYLPGEADHREEGTACQVCLLHHPLDHHGCWMDGWSRTLKDFSWQGLQGSLADWCDCPWWHHGHLDQKSIWRHEDLHLFGSFRMDLPILHQQISPTQFLPTMTTPTCPVGDSPTTTPCSGPPRRDWNANPREPWTLPQGPWTVLEEMGRQGGIIV